MNWSATEGTTAGGKSRPSRTHSAAVNDWLGRTSSVGLGSSRATASYATDGLAGQAGHSARLVLTLTGWRRRALFGLLLTLTVIVIINLSLTLWLLRSMQFSLVSLIFHYLLSIYFLDISTSRCHTRYIYIYQIRLRPDFYDLIQSAGNQIYLFLPAAIFYRFVDHV